MNIIKLIPAGLVASAGISFFSPISANADSIFVEGQLIAGAGSLSACEAKGKKWKSASNDWTDAECNTIYYNCTSGSRLVKTETREYYICSGRNDCSCQK